MNKTLLFAGSVLTGSFLAVAAMPAQEVGVESGDERVAVSLRSDTLQMTRGEQRQLKAGSTAAATDTGSAPGTTWWSQRPTVATVDGSGEVLARALGTTWIVASSISGRDSVPVKVVDVTTRERVGATPNEPPGFARITERRFERAREEGWTASGGLDLQIVRNRGGTPLTSSAGQIRFPAGFEGGRTPTWTTLRGLDAFGARSLYLSFLVKLSVGWEAPRNGVSKLGFVWIHDNPVVTPVNWMPGRGSIMPQVRLQDTPAGARNLSPNLRPVRIGRGEWHRWEILLRANSEDREDGEVHWWIDGVKAGEYRDVTFGSRDQDDRWQTVAWRPTWGGAGDVVNRDMFMWMAHLYVSGRRER